MSADQAQDRSRGLDPVIEAYLRDVDRSLLRENLKLSPEQRVQRLVAFLKFTEELRHAGGRIR